MAERRAVLVTGASSGIGRACAADLLRRGFRVLAGVRTESAAAEARTSGLEPVMLDVADDVSVAGAARAVEAALAGEGLLGLVNNAGIAIGGPLEVVPLDLFRRQIEVNVTGQLAVTQAFLPFVRRARGRIVFMGSVSGLLALPFMGPYSASKFALEAIADTLRLELRAWGIHVAIVEPGTVATPIWEKSVSFAREWLERMPADARERYGAAAENMMKGALHMGQRGIPPQAVADAVAHALTAARPRARYLVAPPNRARQVRLLRRLPEPFRDRLILGRMDRRPRPGDT